MTKDNPDPDKPGFGKKQSEAETPYPTEVIPPSEIGEASVIREPRGMSSYQISKRSGRSRGALTTRLREIRQDVIASGEPLLALDEVEHLIDRRRGTPVTSL